MAQLLTHNNCSTDYHLQWLADKTALNTEVLALSEHRKVAAGG